MDAARADRPAPPPDDNTAAAAKTHRPPRRRREPLFIVVRLLSPARHQTREGLWEGSTACRGRSARVQDGYGPRSPALTRGSIRPAAAESKSPSDGARVCEKLGRMTKMGRAP